MTSHRHKKLPNLYLLKELLIVTKDSPSGLRWKKPRKLGRAKAGKIAGHLDSSGYWLVNIKTDKSRLYKAHRIIFYMQTGIDPEDKFIDHKTNKENNLNLRLATKGQNNINVHKRKTHNKKQPTSKYKGVSKDAKTNTWRARIHVNKKSIYIGRFKTEEDAALAYNEKAKELHGEFAVLNSLNTEV